MSAYLIVWSLHCLEASVASNAPTGGRQNLEMTDGSSATFKFKYSVKTVGLRKQLRAEISYKDLLLDSVSCTNKILFPTKLLKRERNTSYNARVSRFLQEEENKGINSINVLIIFRG